nr:FAD-binding oxidoreductase [Rhodococcus rhodnii]
MQQWQAEVVQHHRLRDDTAVVRLIGGPVPFAVGQHVEVGVPQAPGAWRRLSPALPPSRDGKLEFHVRSVPGGQSSGAMVADTRPGDTWTIRDPRGDLAVDENGGDVVMIADGTGLAPMRALLLDLAARERQPKVFLFAADRTPQDLYAADMLCLLVQQLPWLTVIPVVRSRDERHDPFYEHVRRATELSSAATFAPDDIVVGEPGEIVASYGAFVDQQVLVCGSPVMVGETVDLLLESGTPVENIAYDA